MLQHFPQPRVLISGHPL
uniref:Uncharacterized protein n=1 Tax=Arundo donax TaxID=35708 RepID=A0A0A9GTJ5_ARUDO